MPWLSGSDQGIFNNGMALQRRHKDYSWTFNIDI